MLASAHTLQPLQHLLLTCQLDFFVLPSTQQSRCAAGRALTSCRSRRRWASGRPWVLAPPPWCCRCCCWCRPGCQPSVQPSRAAAAPSAATGQPRRRPSHLRQPGRGQGAGWWRVKCGGLYTHLGTAGHDTSAWQGSLSESISGSAWVSECIVLCTAGRPNLYGAMPAVRLTCCADEGAQVVLAGVLLGVVLHVAALAHVDVYQAILLLGSLGGGLCCGGLNGLDLRTAPAAAQRETVRAVSRCSCAGVGLCVSLATTALGGLVLM